MEGIWVMILAAICLQSVVAIRFELTPGSTKCVYEEIQSNVLVVGDYHIIKDDLPPGSQPKIFARVTSPHGATKHLNEDKEEGQFAFTTSEAGNYMACFWMQLVATSAPVDVDLDWKTGYAAKDWANIAKREKIEGVELELRKLEDVVDAIHEEMVYLKEKEVEMRNVNETTNARVAWFSIMSLFICLAVAAWQLWHLKSYFERKKLL